MEKAVSHSRTHYDTRRLVRMAVLSGHHFCWPLHLWAVGDRALAATTIQMPVIIGAVLMGPTAGAILGGFLDCLRF